MKQTVKGTLFILELNELDSSFIKQIVYDAKTDGLSVVLKNQSVYNYKNVPMETFLEFSTTNSFGSFYNSNIKNKFKHVIMAKENSNQPKRINKAGNFKRYIKMSIDVTKLNKDWFYFSRDEDGNIKAVYAKITLCMLPDGETDKYGQLGFIVQDVPADVMKEAPANAKPRGEILGNGEELEWKREEEKVERVTTAEEADDILDDLPF
jgi:hypothetical protein